MESDTMAGRGNNAKPDPWSECQECGGKYDPTGRGRSRLCGRCFAKIVSTRRDTLAEQILREDYPQDYQAHYERINALPEAERVMKWRKLLQIVKDI